MDWKLEVVIVPVTDVERSKEFYNGKLGFPIDVDTQVGPMRIIQMTPTGSGCSVTIGSGLSQAEPGSLKGVQISVADIDAARAELVGRGVDVTPVRHLEGGTWVDGKGEDWNSFMTLDDPDGNTWTIQESPRMREAL